MRITSFEQWINESEKSKEGRINLDTFKEIQYFLKSAEAPGSTSVSTKVDNFYNEFDRLNKTQKHLAKEALKTAGYLRDVELVINPVYCAMDLRYSQEIPNYSYTSSNRPKLSNLPEDTVKFCVRWFVHSGLSLEGACALVGNLWRESYLNPFQKQIEGGPGRGLAQWSVDERWSTFVSSFFPKFRSGHTMLTNITPYHIESQLAFIVYELKNSYREVYNSLVTIGNIENKTIQVLKYYEVARDKDVPSEQNKRISLAKKCYAIASGDDKLPIINNIVQILKNTNRDLFA